MRMTLREWQKKVKSKELILYNCSEFFKGNDEWVTFPIGIGYKFFFWNDTVDAAQLGSHNELALCLVDPHTDKQRRPRAKNRESILKTISYLGFANAYLFTSNEYFKQIPNYKFVFSPEGNGIDCHRHYEALIAGCIPIVERSKGIEDKYGDCPILYTDDYSEMTQTYLEGKYEEMLDKEWDFSRLLLSSYSLKDQIQIKANGNFWCNKFSGHKWYE